MHGKFLALSTLGAALMLNLSACQTWRHQRMEQADTKPAATAAAPAEASSKKAEPPANSPEKSATSSQPLAHGQASAESEAQIRLVDKNGKSHAAPAEAHAKPGEKEMTKVDVASHENEQAEAARALHEVAEKAAHVGEEDSKVAAAEVSDAPTPEARHAGPIPAAKALLWMQHGNTRFVKGYLRKDGESAKDRKRLVAGQQPHAAVLTCSDSRVPPELVFDQKLGEIYVVRVSGNIMSNNTISGLEYAVQYLGTNLVVLLGHANCDASDEAVRQTLLDKSKIIRDAVASGEVKVARGFYHLDTGVVDWKQ